MAKAAKPAIEPLKAVKVGMISKGDGVNKPKKGDTVHVTYIGRFHGGQRHGQVFDHTTDELFTFQLGYRQVIRGWDAGFKHLSLGTKAMLQIPAQYAYGDGGVPNPEYKKPKKTKGKNKNKNKNKKDKTAQLFEQYAIPPKQDLAFEVQLLGINDLRWQEPKPESKETDNETKTNKDGNDSNDNSNENPNANNNENQDKPKTEETQQTANNASDKVEKSNGTSESTNPDAGTDASTTTDK